MDESCTGGQLRLLLPEAFVGNGVKLRIREKGLAATPLSQEYPIGERWRWRSVIFLACSRSTARVAELPTTSSSTISSYTQNRARIKRPHAHLGSGQRSSPLRARIRRQGGGSGGGYHAHHQGCGGIGMCLIKHRVCMSVGMGAFVAYRRSLDCDHERSLALQDGCSGSGTMRGGTVGETMNVITCR